MKILHTSDWHIGHQLYQYDRHEEHAAMLERIADIIRQEMPDALVVAGDIFHVSGPSAQVQKLLVDALLEMRKIHPEMAIVVTAGNHDSGSRHEVFRQPWSVLGVTMIGSLHLDTPDDHIIELPGKGYIIAVPYAHERFMPEGFHQMLLDMVEARNGEGLPVVMTAHTTVSGADFAGHTAIEGREGRRYVGGIEGMAPEAIGEGFDYLALGHIHRGQFVHSGREGEPTIRYSGAPLAVSFDEDYPHTVSIVEIAAHGALPKVRLEEIHTPWPLVNLPKKGSADWASALKALRNFPSATEAYVRLNVTQSEPLLAGAFDEARQAAGGKKCRVCTINYRRVSDDTARELPSLSVSQFKKESPTEIARRFIEGAGGAFGQEMAGMMEEVMREIEQSEKN